MKSLFKLVFLIYLVYSSVGCIKVPQSCSKNYAFGIPISVTPQDTFIVGDTIWWEMDMPNQLFDTTSGTYVDLTDFELFFWFGVGKLEHNGPIQSYVSSFDFVAEIGRVEPQFGAIPAMHFLTQSIQDKRFRIGCIPRQVGTYDAGISFPDLYFNGEGLLSEELQIVDPNCKEFITQRSKITINNKEINYHMMEGICGYMPDGNQLCYGPESEIPMYNSYAFHVKEP